MRGLESRWAQRLKHSPNLDLLTSSICLTAHTDRGALSLLPSSPGHGHDDRHFRWVRKRTVGTEDRLRNSSSQEGILPLVYISDFCSVSVSLIRPPSSLHSHLFTDTWHGRIFCSLLFTKKKETKQKKKSIGNTFWEKKMMAGCVCFCVFISTF